MALVREKRVSKKTHLIFFLSFRKLYVNKEKWRQFTVNQLFLHYIAISSNVLRYCILDVSTRTAPAAAAYTRTFDRFLGCKIYTDRNFNLKFFICTFLKCWMEICKTKIFDFSKNFGILGKMPLIYFIILYMCI